MQLFQRGATVLMPMIPWLLLSQFIIKINAQWAASLEGSGNDVINAVAVDSSDSIVILSAFDRLSWLSVTSPRSQLSANCPTGSSSCLLITKLDANGTFLWRTYVVYPWSYASNTRGVDITFDSFGNILATIVFSDLYVLVYDANLESGGTLGNSWGDGFEFTDQTDSAAVIKWTSNGTYLWSAKFDGYGDELLRSVTTDNAGSVYVGGMTDSWDIEIYGPKEELVKTVETFCEDGPCGAVLKYSANGTFQWAHFMTNILATQIRVLDIKLDSLGTNLYVAGYISFGSTLSFRNINGQLLGRLSDMSTSNTGFFAQISASTGGFNWATRFRYAVPNKMAIGTDNSVVLVGQVVGGSAVLFDRSLAQVAILPKIGTTAAFMAKYSSTGSFLWSVRMTGLTTSSSESANAVTIDKQNNVIVGGEFFSQPLTIFDANNVNVTVMQAVGSSGGFIAKFTPSGNLVWTCRLDSAARDSILDLTSDSINNIVVAGTHNGQGKLYDTVGNPSLVLDVSAVDPGSSGVMLVMRPDGIWPYTPPVTTITSISTTPTSTSQLLTPSIDENDNNPGTGSEIEAATLMDVDFFTMSIVAGGALIGSFAAVFAVIFKSRRTGVKLARHASDAVSLLSGPRTALSASQYLAGTETVTKQANRTQTQVATTHELSIPAFLERKWGFDFREGKLIATGGGGSLFTCEILNPEWKEVRHQSLAAKKVGETLETLSARQQRQFFQELSIMWKFRDNRTFCRVYGFSVAPVGLVMRFYELGDLNHYIEGRGLAAQHFPYTKFTVVRIAREFVAAVKTLHDAGIAHCDVKTQNILLDRDSFGQLFPVMTDFGISRIVAGEMHVKAFEKADINGMSPLYAAPEMLKRIREGSPFSDAAFFKHADIYSIAMTLLALNSRREPWVATRK